MYQCRCNNHHATLGGTSLYPYFIEYLLNKEKIIGTSKNKTHITLETKTATITLILSVSR